MAILRRLSVTMLLVLASLQRDGVAALTFKDDVYALEGQSVLFLCVMDYREARPITKPNGDWTWNGKEGNQPTETILKYGFGSGPTKGKSDLAQRSRIIANTHRGNFSLIVQKVRASDTGYFNCRITHNHYVASARRQLHVVRVTFSGSSPALEGDAITLTCHASSSNVTWTTPYAGKRSGATVQIKALTLKDHGRWTCRVQVGEGTLETSYQLDVVGFTDPLLQTVYIPVGSSETLPCSLNQFPASGSVEGGWSLGKVKLASINATGRHWVWFEGQDRRLGLLKAGRRAEDLSVQVRPATLQDSGNYSCQLQLLTRAISRTVSVSVIQVNASRQDPVTRGQNISLTCRVSDSSRHTSIQWTHNNDIGKVTQVTSKSHTVTVDITRVNESKSGFWICGLYSGKERVGMAKYWLNVTDQPIQSLSVDKSTLFLIVGIVVVVVTISTIAIVIGVCLAGRRRRRRRAVRRLRYPLCREHSNQLSNQPLCSSNEYTQADRPLPPLPSRYCPHNQPRRGRPSQVNSSRRIPKNVYMA